MEDDLPRITPTTSAMHLAIAKKEFSRATNRKERIEIAEKHKRYMLGSDINMMRAEFNLYHPMKKGD